MINYYDIIEFDFNELEMIQILKKIILSILFLICLGLVNPVSATPHGLFADTTGRITFENTDIPAVGYEVAIVIPNCSLQDNTCVMAYSLSDENGNYFISGNNKVPFEHEYIIQVRIHNTVYPFNTVLFDSGILFYPNIANHTEIGPLYRHYELVTVDGQILNPNFDIPDSGHILKIKKPKNIRKYHR